ncbi:tetratricopeptide repeat protein [Pseudomarimonas salicorniae]|uniref:Tetratricopeptide repeat protein n=1 Tax=Pseudomarimonas salicorniae TaxID=2933270 RepID=A0ABT0GG85_9GAMM|nr:tetratricopeptide repeat protein [Lysobacter sp. CAU 1642]MCK7593554.1 tetratricopeptide repeat protein [Lysobacter sp. CAU 1642]
MRRVAWMLLLALACSPASAQRGLGELLGEARAARDAGQLEQAIAAYDAMLDQVADHETAMLERAQTLAWDGQYAASIAAYRAFRERYPGRARAADLGLAQVQAWSEDIPGALQTLRPWVAGRDREAVRQDATYRAWAGHTGEAVARLESWLADHPDDREAALDRARFLSWSGDFETAAASYDALLKADPTLGEAALGRTRLALWSGNPALARERFAACDAACRQTAEGRLMAARLDAAEGRRREAATAYRQLAQGGAAQRDARELLFDDISERGRWLELRGVRTRTNEGLEQHRPHLRMRLPWFDGHLQVEAARREVAFAGANRDALQWGVQLHQPVGGRAWWMVGLGRDQDLGGKPAGTWQLGGGLRPGGGLRLQLDASRQLLDFTPAAVDQRGSLQALEANIGWTPLESPYNFDLGLARAWLSAGSQRKSFALAATRRIPLSSVDWRVSAVGRGFGYSETLDLGFFNPERYRHLGLRSRWVWREARRYELSFGLSAGRQWVNQDEGQFTWGLDLGAERVLGDGRWALFAQYARSLAGLPVATAGDPSDYREYTVQLGLRWRERP